MSLHELSQKALEKKFKDALTKDGTTRISDGESMYLKVRSKDGKSSSSWTLDYQLFKRPRKSITFGTYPKMTLSTARELAQQARERVQRGEDPVQAKREVAKKVESDKRVHETTILSRRTVAQLTADWLAFKEPEWGAANYKDYNNAIKKDILPFIGADYISAVTSEDIHLILKRIEDRGSLDKLSFVRSAIAQIFEYAVDDMKIETNPVAKVKRVRYGRHIGKSEPAIVEPIEFAKLLQKIDSQESTITIMALKFQSMVFVRPGNLRFGKWDQINFEERTWLVPYEQMKMDRAFLVPLSNQAMRLLSNLKTITGDYELIFPMDGGKPMGDTTLSKRLQNLGYKDIHVPHGFRHSAKTMLEEGGFDSKLTEKQLAHEFKSKVEKAYNKAEYWPARVEMMQGWSDYLDVLRTTEGIPPTPWRWFADWRKIQSMLQPQTAPN